MSVGIGMRYRSLNVSARLALGGGGLLVLVVAAALTALALGPVHISLGHILATVFHHGEFTPTEQAVVEQLRMPRILMAGLVGAALGISGAAMQGLFRNPLADPGIIGVSSGAATGAVLAIAAGAGASFSLTVPFFAFGGAVVAATLVYLIAMVGGRFSMATLLLAGVAVSAFLGAIIAAVLVSVSRADAQREILFWLTGGLDGRTWADARIAAPFIAAGLVPILYFARDLNALMLGDEEAAALGIRVRLVRTLLLLAAALTTGAAVAFSGTIAFVGLITPHVLRLLAGPDNRVLIPLSALGGALFLIVADTVARTVVQPAEFHVGMITAFVGAPFFLLLLVRNKRQAEAF